MSAAKPTNEEQQLCKQPNQQMKGSSYEITAAKSTKGSSYDHQPNKQMKGSNSQQPKQQMKGSSFVSSQIKK